MLSHLPVSEPAAHKGGRQILPCGEGGCAGGRCRQGGFRGGRREAELRRLQRVEHGRGRQGQRHRRGDERQPGVSGKGAGFNVPLAGPDKTFAPQRQAECFARSCSSPRTLGGLSAFVAKSAPRAADDGSNPPCFGQSARLRRRVRTRCRESASHTTDIFPQP